MGNWEDTPKVKEMLRVKHKAYVRERIRENLSRPPILCICSRGFNTTIFGCDECTREAGNAYEKWLMSLTIKKGRLVE